MNGRPARIRPPTQAFGDMRISSSASGSSRSASTSGSGMARTPSSHTTPGDAGERSEQQQDRLIVGIDFGTTYSGVAVVYSGAPEDIEVIKSWPGGNGITSDKVPTEIAYPPKSLSSSSSLPNTSRTTNQTPAPRKSTSYLSLRSSPNSTAGPPFKWGFQLKPEERRLRCIKLFLDRTQTLPTYISPLETAHILRDAEKNVLGAVSDYLTAIHRHTIDTLTRRYGATFMATTAVEWVLTTPAAFSDSAKHATLKAAENAGLGGGPNFLNGIRLISEPEAAAVHTLKQLQPNSLHVGDHFVVCDAGGGTVDVITYKLNSIRPLLMEESLVGSGALCGSAFLNYAFEDHCRRRLGADVYDNMKPRTKMMGLKNWDEYVKRNFKGDDDDEEMAIPFPGLPDIPEAGVEDGFLILTGSEVKAIFDPIVTDVIRLCERQVDGVRQKDGKVAGIVLVGGFGQSNYLYNRLREHFNSPPPAYSGQQYTGIEIMQPLYAWTAVVRGAVIRGLEGTFVQHRKSRCHYGTSYATVYDDTKHPAQDRYWSPLWERWMVGDRMQWHIARGEAVSERVPISFHYTRNFKPGQSLVVEDDLISCELDEAPDSLQRDKVQTVCTLVTDLSAVPSQCFTRLTTSKGTVFDNLDFTLDMKIDSARLIFELKVDGVRYGSVTARFH